MGKGKKDASVYLLMGFRGIPEVLGAGVWPYFGFNLHEIDSRVRLSRVTELGKQSGLLPMTPRELRCHRRWLQQIGTDWGNRRSHVASV